MQPMMAMVTPGRWPVAREIFSVTSWRSKRVLPQDGQETNSVLTFRIRDPCRRPKDADRRKSTSKGASTRTPSPRPSTKSEPPSMPIRRMNRSFRRTPDGDLADCASYDSLWITGTGDSWDLSKWNTRRVACNREISSVGTSRSTNDGLSSFAAAKTTRPFSRSSSASSPRTTTAVPMTLPSRSSSSLRNSARDLTRMAFAGKSDGSPRWSSGGINTPRPAAATRSRVRRCVLSRAGRVPGLR
mmetsp:Transcript_5782/g.18831  ORF Transcript_5782/g.18831 Transcript_5782/m.18831 type:complete len:243 (+) Transcript_5782:461-1189(+)